MYDIEGWINNEGSGVDVVEPANYVPPEYKNPAWDTAEHYAYQPGTEFQSAGDYPGEKRTGGGGNLSSGGGGSTMSISPFGSSSKPVSSSGSSRGSSSSIQNLVTGRNTTTSYLSNKALPTFNLPSAYTAPTFAMPTYDQGRINYLAQQQFAPIQTKLQNALYTGMGKVAATDNPYLQSKARKDLLQGYGGGLSEGQAAASRTGQQLYAPEYQGKVTEAQTNYQGQTQAGMANYQAQMTQAQALFEAAMQDWQKSLQTTISESIGYNGQPPANTTSGLYTPEGSTKSYQNYEDYIGSGDYMNKAPNAYIGTGYVMHM